MRGSDASEAQRCHELIPSGILMDNSSATILLHTRLDNSISYTRAVPDTTVSRITRLDNSIACSTQTGVVLPKHFNSSVARDAIGSCRLLGLDLTGDFRLEK